MELKTVDTRRNEGEAAARWQERRLGDLTEFINGKPHERYIVIDGDFALITIDSIDRSGRLKTIHRRTNVCLMPLKKDDIVTVLDDLAHGDLLGLSDVVASDHGYTLNQRMGCLRLKVRGSAEFVRLQINFRQRHFKDRGQGLSQKHVYRRDFDALNIPWPDVPEQVTIAETLSDANALIESLEQLVIKKCRIKQGAMHELLTGKKRLLGFESRAFKQSELGPLPIDWNVSTFGTQFIIQLGKMLDSERNQGIPKPFLGNRAVRWGEIDVSDLDEVRLTPRDLQRFRLRPGDLLVCEGGEVGRAAIWNGSIEECYYQKAVHRLRPIGTYNVLFAMYWLHYCAMTGTLTNYVTQTSIAHLPKDKFETVPLPVPATVAEQTAIATCLSDMDTEIAAVERRLLKVRHVKQGLMQELLTGRIRLVDERPPTIYS